MEPKSSHQHPRDISHLQNVYMCVTLLAPNREHGYRFLSSLSLFQSRKHPEDLGFPVECQWSLEQKSGSSVPTAAPLCPSYCQNCTVKEKQRLSQSWLYPVTTSSSCLAIARVQSYTLFLSCYLSQQAWINVREKERAKKGGKNKDKVKDGGENVEGEC